MAVILRMILMISMIIVMMKKDKTGVIEDYR